MLILNSFNDFFIGTYSTLINQNSRLISISGSYLISNSFFIDLFFNGNGGSISFTSNSMNLVIENSIFINCKSLKSNGLGGGIYIWVSSSNFGLKNICGSRCSCENNGAGQFSCISSSSNNFIHEEYCSISKSITLSGSQTQIYYNSNMTTKNCNSSLHQVPATGIIRYENPSQINILYSTYVGIQSNYYGLLTQSGSQDNRFINECNIFNNSINNEGVITTWYSSKWYINNCTFSKNKNILFYSNTGLIIIYNSFIDSYSYGGVIPSTTLIQQFQNTFYLKHFQTNECFGEKKNSRFKIHNFKFFQNIFFSLNLLNL